MVRENPPIVRVLPEVVSTLRRSSCLVLKAPPGAGKTTCVPRAILDSGLAQDLEILVLQPRRLATRLAAQWVASELGQPLGQTVGYQVRFESVGGPQTRLRYMTEGVLERRLLSDPTLKAVGAVVLDEFHERHLSGDLCLALLRRLQLRARPDLKLAVMSATLEVGPIAAFLGNCPVIESEGRSFEVAIEHVSATDSRPLEQQVLSGLKWIERSGLGGHILVFLPGAAEIRRASEACGEFARRRDLELHPLHGDLPAADQDRAVAPSDQRKLILSTNVAETSVTIPGVSVVLDSGLARVASHSPWSGLPTLKLARISKASAAQRAGRAGRTAPGSCLRLYTQHEFNGLPNHDVPEVQRADLSGVLLTLQSLGVTDLAQFPFFDPPPPASVSAADQLLRRLGALGPDHQLTDKGKRMAELPLHPRLAALVADGERRGIVSSAVAAAALLSERDIRQHSRVNLSMADSRSTSRRDSGVSSDLIDLLDRFEQARSHNFDQRHMRDLSLSPSAVQSVERIRKHLMRTARPAGKGSRETDFELLLRASLLAAYPDRVAKRRSKGSREVFLFGGGVAHFNPGDGDIPEWLVALDAEERTQGHGPRVTIQLASPIEPEWLLDLAENPVASEDVLEWNSESNRVDRIGRLSYGNLLIEETRAPAPPSPETTEILSAFARSAGVSRFADPASLEQWQARLDLMGRLYPEAGFPTASEESLYVQLSQMCQGARSFDELDRTSLLDLAAAALNSEQRRLLATMAPEQIALANGRQLKIRYERGKPPWVESRLQDFFGMETTPAIGGGRVPLVLHLLAPNRRPVQVTTDLKGFWSKHYPSIRKELSRRYPRHAWPENLNFPAKS